MKAIINSLAMALAMEDLMPLPDALAFAKDWVEQNHELFGPPVIVDYQGRALGAQPIATVPPSYQPGDLGRAITAPEVSPEGVPLYGNENWQRRQERGTGEQAVAAVHIQHVVGPDGLTDAQRIGAATVGLCPNCQQPKNNHLPGCLRDPRAGFTEKEQGRAITKDRLPPRA